MKYKLKGRRGNVPFEVEGITFEAVRFDRPIPHWRLKLPTGEILDPGVGGFDGSSVPKMKASLQYAMDRLGKERIIRDLGIEEYAPKGESIKHLKGAKPLSDDEKKVLDALEKYDRRHATSFWAGMFTYGASMSAGVPMRETLRALKGLKRRGLIFTKRDRRTRRILWSVRKYPGGHAPRPGLSMGTPGRGLPYDEQKLTDEFEQAAGGPGKAFRLLDLYRRATEIHAGPYVFPPKDLRKRQIESFRKMAKREGYSEKAVCLLLKLQF